MRRGKGNNLPPGFLVETRSVVKIENKISSIRTCDTFIQNSLCQLIVPSELKAKQDKSTVVLPLWIFNTCLDVTWFTSYVHLLQFHR